jgi:hypothetical protein
MPRVSTLASRESSPACPDSSSSSMTP